MWAGSSAEGVTLRAVVLDSFDPAEEQARNPYTLAPAVNPKSAVPRSVVTQLGHRGIMVLVSSISQLLLCLAQSERIRAGAADADIVETSSV